MAFNIKQSSLKLDATSESKLTAYVSQTGMFSGIPHIGRMILAYGVSAGCDYLLQHNKMSATNVRKLAISICKY